MKIRIDYDKMFTVNSRDAVVATAMRNIKAHQLAGLVEVVPELPEAWQGKFEVEINDPLNV